MNIFTAFLELPEDDRRLVGAYIYCRTFVQGARPGEMTPVELMRFLTKTPGEPDAD